jgi:dolichyl-phosphate beta-glucosyltransferase
MAERLSLSIVVPAFNEERRIGPTVEATLVFLDGYGKSAEIVVVDDGSRDATSSVVAEIARRDARVRCLVLPENRGKGAAVRRGMLDARGDRALFMDADLAPPIEELAKLDGALDDGADIAIGSRALPEADIRVRQNPIRESMGKTFNALVRAVALRGIPDTQCGFKLFTRASAQVLFAEATVDRFAFDVEILLRAQGRYRVAQIPVAWRHVERSTVSPIRDASRMAVDLLLVAWRVRRERRGR